MADGKDFNTKYSRLAGCLAALVIYNLLLTAAVSFGAYYTLQNNNDLQGEINLLKTKLNVMVEEEGSAESKRKREVISSGNNIPSWINKLTAGPQGPPGKDGKDGKDGRDGRDSASLAAIEKVVNITVARAAAKEWTQLSSRLPSYGGATYVRWGRTICPATSKMVYKGQMAGPHRSSVGGGVNFQCLPSDPEYDSNSKVFAPYSDLAFVIYNPIKGDVSLPGHRVPCVVCETNQRVSQLMIPAKTRCPTSDWVLEYRGYIMSPPSNEGDGSLIKDERFNRNTYECVDGEPETSTGDAFSHSYTGSFLYMVKARCSGPGAFPCPPFQGANKPLSCVVCSK